MSHLAGPATFTAGAKCLVAKATVHTAAARIVKGPLEPVGRTLTKKNPSAPGGLQAETFDRGFQKIFKAELIWDTHTTTILLLLLIFFIEYH